MGLFKKKPDPISERARALSEQLARLQDQIQDLSAREAKIETQKPRQPKLRSTALPHGPTVATHSAPPPAPPEPVFEDLDQDRLKTQPEATTPEHYNELGIRKYDLPAAWRRFANHFRGPPASNPRLVNYLAAGSIQGLRPLRYEKRVARNRFLFFLVCLILVLLGVIAVFMRH